MAGRVVCWALQVSAARPQRERVVLGKVQWL